MFHGYPDDLFSVHRSRFVLGSHSYQIITQGGLIYEGKLGWKNHQSAK